MKVVIDVGCKSYGDESSVEFLVEQFKPHVLHGFDPAAAPNTYWSGTTLVVIWPQAAWTHDGTVPWIRGTTTGRVGEGDTKARCVDLSTFIRRLQTTDVILKMDAEGSEYTLLPDLMASGADKLLSMVWVEWHCLACGAGGDHRPGCSDNRSAGLRADIERYWRPTVDMREWTR